MFVGAWSDGRVSRGIRFGKPNRDILFGFNVTKVAIDLPELNGQFTRVECEVSPAFWRSCPEVRSPLIGGWMERLGVFDWQKGHPPRFELTVLGPKLFRLHLPVKGG